MRLFLLLILCLLNPASWAAPAAPVSYSLADHAAHQTTTPRLGSEALLSPVKKAAPRKEQALKKKAAFSKKKPKARKHIKAKRSAGPKKAQPWLAAKHQVAKPAPSAFLKVGLPASAQVKAQPRPAKATAPAGNRPKGSTKANKRRTPPRVPELAPQNRVGLPELPRRPVPLNLKLPRIVPSLPGRAVEVEGRHHVEMEIPVLHHPASAGQARGSTSFVSKLGPATLELLASAVATLTSKGSVHLPLYADRHSALRLELASAPRGTSALLTLNVRLM